jgi:hypothetical protein
MHEACTYLDTKKMRDYSRIKPYSLDDVKEFVCTTGGAVLCTCVCSAIEKVLLFLFFIAWYIYIQTETDSSRHAETRQSHL